MTEPMPVLENSQGEIQGMSMSPRYGVTMTRPFMKECRLQK
jgi:hypothetical protein